MSDSLADLRRRIAVPGPDAWSAFDALAAEPSGAALEVLTETATSRDWRLRHAAIRAIARHVDGRSAAATLRRGLGDAVAQVARAACHAVAELQLIDLHDEVAALLCSADEETRISALTALAACWRPADFERVRQFAESDPSRDVQTCATRIVVEKADASTWRVCADRLLSSPAPHERMYGLDLAARFGAPEDRAGVAAFVRDPDGHVRKAAARIVERPATRSL